MSEHAPEGDDLPDGVTPSGAPDEPPAAPEPVLVPLNTPRDGVPDVVDSESALAEVVTRFAAGTGPVAIDAERASGHRYGQRAFLVQLRREGSGSALVDPAALPDLSALGAALCDVEWVLHAAGQDLPCLAEVGLVPSRLFDTELAARLAGFERVGLAAVVQQLLGLSLAKEHSAVDWSVRPLPEPWLRYAVLDVEVLLELRELLAADLERQGKLDWAMQEFAAIVAAPAATPRIDPWRRTSGLHRVRDRRRLAAVRELWQARDGVARERDVSPGRIVPDTALVEAALAMPTSQRDLTQLTAFTGRGSRRYASEWFAALEAARAVPDEALPPLHLPLDGPPPPRSWPDRDPAAAARLAACRAALGALATTHALPVENLVSPDAVRRLAWAPPSRIDPETVTESLLARGARPWQIGLVCGPLVAALSNDALPSDDSMATVS